MLPPTMRAPTQLSEAHTMRTIDYVLASMLEFRRAAKNALYAGDYEASVRLYRVASRLHDELLTLR